MKGEALKGHLDLLILAAVDSEPLHGYAIIENLRRRSDGLFDLPEGTVYPALHRLEQAGLLSSTWSSTAGRRRRVYRLTRQGGRAMSRQTEAWRQFAGAMTAIVTPTT